MAYTSATLAQNQISASSPSSSSSSAGRWEPPRKELVYRPTGEVVTTYESLETKLFAMGWKPVGCPEPSPPPPPPAAFRSSATARGVRRSIAREYELRKSAASGELHLTVPIIADFRNLDPIHLYAIIVHTRCTFDARDVTVKTYAC